MAIGAGLETAKASGNATVRTMVDSLNRDLTRASVDSSSGMTRTSIGSMAGPDAEAQMAIARTFVSFSDTLTDNFDLDYTLGCLLDVCCRLVDGAEVSVLMRDESGTLRVMAASSERKRVLEQYQIEHDEGPSLDAFATGEQSIVVGLESQHSRWPRFTQLAKVVGYNVIQSIPLRLRNETIGVLSIAETSDRERPPLESVLLRTVADCTAIGLINRRVYGLAKELGRQLQGALSSRVLIEQAKGVVAARLGISVEQAFEMLRSHARCSNRKLNDVARAIIDGNLPTHDLWPQVPTSRKQTQGRRAR